jgi:hypothetical protein
MPKIRILAKKQPMQFLITDPPRAWIDGAEVMLAWDQEAAIPVEPGSHQVILAYQYMGADRGRAEATVEAGDPGPLIRYRSPLWMWSKGHLKVAA